jgi:putative nucleotidyltransferase with HDIG domain
LTEKRIIVGDKFKSHTNMTATELCPNMIPLVDYVGQRPYDDLLVDAKEIAKQNGINGSFLDTTFRLLGKLARHDEDAAIGGLRTLPIAMEIADEISGFYGINMDPSPIFGGALLHDIGKLVVPQSLLQKSTAGLEWTASDRLAMQAHVSAGGAILRSRGFPQAMVRAVEEHHHKQAGGTEYGVDCQLANDERIYRDAIAMADFEEADINRTNTRNRGLSRQQREQEIAEDVAYVLGDYSDCSVLVERVMKRSLG